MSLNGGWVSYGGDAKIELAARPAGRGGLRGLRGNPAAAPPRAARPPAPVVVLMFSLWVLALIAFAGRAGGSTSNNSCTTIPTSHRVPITPSPRATLLAAAAHFRPRHDPHRAALPDQAGQRDRRRDGRRR